MSHNPPNPHATNASQDRRSKDAWQTLPEADKITHLDQLFEKTLYRARCPSAEMLGDLNAGMLSQTQAQAIQSHVETCPHCSAELARLQTWLTEFPQPAEPKQPSAWRRVKRYIAQELSTIARRSGNDTFDAVPATRSADEDLTQYIYLLTVESSVPIILDVEADERYVGQFKLIGQSSFETEQTLQATLWRTGEPLPIASGSVSTLGEFRFGNLPTGHYELILSNEQTEIYLRDIEI